MTHLALPAAIAILIAMSSCATDQDPLPAPDAELRNPEDADKALVCRFGNGSTDEKKGCTTATQREDAKPAPEIPFPSRQDSDR